MPIDTEFTLTVTGKNMDYVGEVILSDNKRCENGQAIVVGSVQSRNSPFPRAIAKSASFCDP